MSKPAFTKQHYIEVARTIKQSTQATLDDDAPTLLALGCARDRLIASFSHMFRSDNPSFSSERFEDACREGLIQARKGTKARKAF